MDEEENPLEEQEAEDDTQASLGDLGAQYDIPGADDAYSSLAKSSEDARAALRNAREQILARKYNKALPLLAVSAALGAPTRSGSFAESFGNMSGALMGPLREQDQFERERQKELLGVDSAISGIDQRMAQSQLSLAGMRAKLAQQERNLPLEKILDAKGNRKLVTRYDARGKPFFVPPTAGTTINLHPENDLYGGMGKELAKVYTDQYKAAQSAPEAYQRASRIVKLLDRGAFTGTAANYKLNVGKALQAVGIKLGKDPVENTEALVAEMARGTLDLVKTSGLAGSQGLTEGERKFLERAVAGQITMENKSLRRLAALNKRISRNSIGAWNAVFGRLKQPQLQQLGMVRIEMPEDEEEPLEFESLPSGARAAPATDAAGGSRRNASGQPFDEDNEPAYDPAKEEDVINFEDLK